jgi:hypothetical protein
MEVGSMMMSRRTETELADLAKHRSILRGCIEMGQSAVKFMREANDDLAAAIQAAEKALAEAGLGSPTAGMATGAGSPPATDAKK